MSFLPERFLPSVTINETLPPPNEKKPKLFHHQSSTLFPLISQQHQQNNKTTTSSSPSPSPALQSQTQQQQQQCSLPTIFNVDKSRLMQITNVFKQFDDRNVVRQQQYLSTFGSMGERSTFSMIKQLERSNYQDNETRGDSYRFVGYIDRAAHRQVPQRYIVQQQFMVAELTALTNIANQYKCLNMSEASKQVIPTSAMDLSTYDQNFLSKLTKQENRLLVVGFVPMVSPHVIYDLYVQERYSARYSQWQWYIQECRVSLPWYNIEKFVKSARYFVSLNIKDKNEKKQVRKQLMRQLAICKRDFLVVNERNNVNVPHDVGPDWYECLRTKNLVGEKILSYFKFGQQANYSRIYNNIAKYYNAKQLFYNNNTWWYQLPDRVKSAWEHSLSKLEESYNICFLDCMPSILIECDQQEEKDQDVDADENQQQQQKKHKKTKKKIQSTIDYKQTSIETLLFGTTNSKSKSKPKPKKRKKIVYDSDDDQDGDDEEDYGTLSDYEEDLTDLSINNNSIDDDDDNNNSDEDYQIESDEEEQEVNNNNNSDSDEHHKQLCKQLSSLLKKINIFENILKNHNKKHGNSFTYVPELSANAFRQLAKDKNWKSNVVPCIDVYISSVDAYEWFKTYLKENSHYDCFIPFPTSENNLVNANQLTNLTIGLNQLCKKNVLVKVHVDELAEKMVVVDHYDDNENNKDCYLIMKHWYDAKTLLATILLHIQNYTDKKPFLNRSLLNRELNEDETKFCEKLEQNRLVCLFGMPGTGKTEFISLTPKLINTERTKMVASTFVGKAVDVLKQRGLQCNTSTIHLLMNNFELRKHPIGFLVIDEMSMVSELLLMELMSKVRPRRILFVGDPNQIATFGCCHGDVFSELLKCVEQVKLTTNYRQRNTPNSYILPNAIKIIEGKTSLEFGNDTFNLYPQMMLNQFIRQHAANYFRDIMFIEGTNADVHHINKQCFIQVLELEKTKQQHSNNNNYTNKIVNWDYQNTISIVNQMHIKEINSTFFPNHRITFFQKGIRSKLDEQDDLANRDYYRHIGCSHNETRTLYLNGEQDEIEDIFIWQRFDVKTHKTISISDAKNNPENHLPFVTRFNCEYINVQKVIQNPLYKHFFPPEQQEDEKKMNIGEIKNRCHTINSSIYLTLKRTKRIIRLSDFFHLGFASTVNKMQGSEADVIAITNPSRMSSRKHLFTAITRARKQVCVFAKNKRELDEVILQPLPIIHCFFHYIFQNQQQQHQQTKII